MPPQQQAAQNQTWEITHPTTGVTIEMTGAQPPSQKDIDAAFASMRKHPLNVLDPEVRQHWASNVLPEMALSVVAPEALAAGATRVGGALMRAAAKRLPSAASMRVTRNIPVEESKILDQFGRPMREAGTRRVTEEVHREFPAEIAPTLNPFKLASAGWHALKGSPGRASVDAVTGLPLSGQMLQSGGRALIGGAGKAKEAIRAAIMSAILGGRTE